MITKDNLESDLKDLTNQAYRIDGAMRYVQDKLKELARADKVAQGQPPITPPGSE